MVPTLHALIGCTILLSLSVFEKTSATTQSPSPIAELPTSDDSDKLTPPPIPPPIEDVSSSIIPTQQSYRSVSSSKQFIVSGKDYDLVSAISSKADSIRENLIRTLGCKNTWIHNISIRLFGTPGSPVPSNPVRLGVNIIANQPTYIINLHIGRGIELENLYGAVTTMLLYEMMLREVELEGIPENILLPPWILIGLEQAILWKSDMADRNLYASLFERGEILSPSEILTEKNPSTNLDATSLAAFKASCGALTLCLLNQNNGKESMMNLLKEAILGSDDPLDLVKRNFPLLNLTSTSLHKWWTLQLSTMATPPLTETMPILLTEQRLDEALKLMQFDPASKKSRQLQIDDLGEVLKLSDLNQQLRNVVNNLIYIGSRSFPTYKPIIVEYSKIIALIQLGKTPFEELKKRLHHVAELRKECVKAGIRTRDYLDWFEISNKRKLSNTFDSYMETMKLVRGRNDDTDTPLSKYLKDIETLYTLPAQAPTPRMEN